MGATEFVAAFVASFLSSFLSDSLYVYTVPVRVYRFFVLCNFYCIKKQFVAQAAANFFQRVDRRLESRRAGSVQSQAPKGDSC